VLEAVLWERARARDGDDTKISTVRSTSEPQVMAQRPVADAVGRSERHSVQAHTLEPLLPHNPHISCLSSAVTACMISGASAATAHRLNSCSAGIKRASPRQWS
jgi:hypothetical protein